jgi:hypothetical protein
MTRRRKSRGSDEATKPPTRPVSLFEEQPSKPPPKKKRKRRAWSPRPIREGRWGHE